MIGLNHLVSKPECSCTVVIDPVAEVEVKPLEQVLLVVHKLQVLVVVLLPKTTHLPTPSPPPLKLIPTVLTALRHRPTADTVTLLLPPETPSNPPENRSHLRRLLLRRDPLTLRLGDPRGHPGSGW